MDTKNMREIEAPVLLFSSNYKTVDFLRDKKLLEVTTRLSLKRGAVVGNTIIDSSGQTFKIISAKKKGNYYPIWRFEFFNPLIYVELEIEKTASFDFPQLKEKALAAMMQNEAVLSVYADIQEISITIKAAKSYQELITTIGSYLGRIERK
jgi:hypothetical protein